MLLVKYQLKNIWKFKEPDTHTHTRARAHTDQERVRGQCGRNAKVHFGKLGQHQAAASMEVNESFLSLVSVPTRSLLLSVLQTCCKIVCDHTVSSDTAAVCCDTADLHTQAQIQLCSRQDVLYLCSDKGCESESGSSKRFLIHNSESKMHFNDFFFPTINIRPTDIYI